MPVGELKVWKLDSDGDFFPGPVKSVSMSAKLASSKGKVLAVLVEGSWVKESEAGVPSGSGELVEVLFVEPGSAPAPKKGPSPSGSAEELDPASLRMKGIVSDLD